MPGVNTGDMRGLGAFISDIRDCKSSEAETKRINKELANIRSKFKGDKILSGYQKRKYVCKLLFIYLLGHEVDFGYAEAVSLLCSNRYREKQIGYLFVSILFNKDRSMMNMVMVRLKEDLNSDNCTHVNLALQCIANIGTRELAESFVQEVPKLIVSGEKSFAPKQSAALCMLSFIRVAPDLVKYDDWAARTIQLIADPHLGVVTSALSLIDALVKRNPSAYERCISLAVSRLSRLVTSSYTDLQDYTYYFVPAPWLSVKLLRLLQNYPPPEDPTVMECLSTCLETILKRGTEPPKSKKVQHSNAKNAVIFEAINLIIHMDCNRKLLTRACAQLGQFLQHKETNLRYLALESLCLMATSELSHDAVKKHLDTVVAALKSERDVSVRQRAVDLLYAVCDRSNASTIVNEMINYLEIADYSIREEMVLKVAILAEKYATDHSWYVDTILSLIRVAGDFVSDEVWHRVIQIVVNREDIQGYAAKTVFEALQAPACHENMIKVGAYILGEFGNLIAGDPRSSPKVQFELLHSKYYLCSLPTRHLMLSTYMKFINLFPEITADIQEVLMDPGNYRCADVEIQQRAVEYLALSKVATNDVLATVLEEMPPFPERESSILAKLKAKNPNSDLSLLANKATARDDTTEKREPFKSISESQAPAVGAEVDLLGLGTPNSDTKANSTSLTPTNDLLLLDILGNGHMSNGAEPEAVNRSQYISLLSKTGGILFENATIQIGLLSQSKRDISQLTLYYGNTSPHPLTNFNAQMTGLIGDSGAEPPVSLELHPGPSQVDLGAQIQQTLTARCHRPFTEDVGIVVSFVCGDTKHRYMLLLPITIGKFIQPAHMDQSLYAMRWKQLSQPGQECQTTFRPQFNTEAQVVKTKLLGFGISNLEGIDPNAMNFVGAGILTTRSQEIGILVRLEPNMPTQGMFRLTVRSTRDVVAKQVCHLLQQQL